MNPPPPQQTTTEGHFGSLGLIQWPGAASTSFVAVPGVDGSGLGFETIACALGPELGLDAIDLRGRGIASSDGPFGVAAHALDVIAHLEQRSEPINALVGHSFGGHVAARVAADRPDLVPRLVLIDGGPARVIPAELTARALAELALGNIVPILGSKPYPVSEAAVRADFLSMVSDDASTTALPVVTVPVSLVRAGNGMAEGMPPVIPDHVVEELQQAGLDLTDLFVPQATHFSLLGDAATPVVDTLRSIV